MENSLSTVVERLTAEGLLTRNSGTNSLKSIKEVNTRSNVILESIDSRLGSMVEVLKSISEIQGAQLVQDKKQDDDAKARAKEDKEDQKRKPKVKPQKGRLQGLKDTMSGAGNKVKDAAQSSGGLLKKILGVAALGFIFKDLIDQWTGGAASKFVNDLTGENGLFSQIKSVAIGIAGLALILAPFKTLKFGFKALVGTVKMLGKSLGKGGLLRRGLSGFGRLFSKGGALRKGLSSFSDMFSKSGGLMKGLSGIGGKFAGLTKSLGSSIGRLGKVGLVAAAGGATAAVANSAGLMDGSRTPGTTSTPDKAGSTSTPRMQTPSSSGTPALSSADVLGDYKPAGATVTSQATVKTPSIPAIKPPAAVGAGATVASAAADAATPKNVLSAASKLSIVAKAVGKNGLKSIPILGAGLGVIFTAMRAWSGDWAGAGLEGAATFAPGPVGLPADIALAVRDVYSEMYRQQYGIEPWNDTPENRAVRAPIIQKEAEDMVKRFMDDKESGKYPPGQLEIKESGSGRNKRAIVVDKSTGEEIQSFGGPTGSKNAAKFIEEHTMSASSGDSGSSAPATMSTGKTEAIAQAKSDYQAAATKEADIQSQINALGTKDTVVGQDQFFGDDIMGFSDPEKQAKYESLMKQKYDASDEKRKAARQYADQKDNVQTSRTGGTMAGLDRFDEASDSADKIEALKARGFTDEQLGRNDNLQSNFVSVNGAKYPMSVIGQYDKVLKQELEGPKISEQSQSSQGVRYDKATSDSAVAASNPANDIKSVIAPVIQNSTNPSVSRGGDTITNNFFNNSTSSFDPAAPMMGR